MKHILFLFVFLMISQSVDATDNKITITGIISGGTGISNIVTFAGEAYDFETNSSMGDKIFAICDEQEACSITGVVENDQFVSVSSVKRVERPILTIPPSTDSSISTDKNIKKKQSIEIIGTIRSGHDAAGGNFWVDGGKKKQYTICYVFGLDEESQAVLMDLADSHVKVKVIGSLRIWKDGSADFDSKKPINIYPN